LLPNVSQEILRKVFILHSLIKTRLLVAAHSIPLGQLTAVCGFVISVCSLNSSKWPSALPADFLTPYTNRPNLVTLPSTIRFRQDAARVCRRWVNLP
jgi:hypothetical protein